MEGWEVVAGTRELEPWEVNRAMYFADSDRKPLSYFAALLRRFDIIDRSATSIPHNRPDAYFRALLGLDRRELQLMLSMEDNDVMDDAWYQKHIKDKDPVICTGSDDDREPPPADDLLALMAAPRSVAVRPERQRWQRQKCDIGPGTREIKVYFDHASPSAEQKGFCPCAASGARRWHQCTTRVSLREYCSAMYAWHCPHSSSVAGTREDHMAYEPPASHIRFVAARLRMSPW